jgi:hypothetical protein
MAALQLARILAVQEPLPTTKQTALLLLIIENMSSFRYTITAFSTSSREAYTLVSHLPTTL